MANSKSPKRTKGLKKGTLSPRALKKQRVKKVKNILGWVGFGLALGTVLLVMLIQVDPYKPGRQIEGTVTTVEAPKNEKAIKVFLEVALDTGDTARMGCLKESGVVKGDRVMVMEMISTIFNKKAYLYSDKLEDQGAQ